MNKAKIMQWWTGRETKTEPSTFQHYKTSATRVQLMYTWKYKILCYDHRYSYCYKLCAILLYMQVKCIVHVPDVELDWTLSLIVPIPAFIKQTKSIYSTPDKYCYFYTY